MTEFNKCKGTHLLSAVIRQWIKLTAEERGYSREEAAGDFVGDVLFAFSEGKGGFGQSLVFKERAADQLSQWLVHYPEVAEKIRGNLNAAEEFQAKKPEDND